MNILSLFDGISCGMLALKEAGIHVDSYYASEIGEKSIDISRSNYPDIIQLGDVQKVSYKDGILYSEKGEYEVKFDMVMGGSPCQNLSNIGDKTGLKGEKSILALDFFRILAEVNPKYFLLENVGMNATNAKIFTAALGVSPIFIDSATFSAQMRKRNYWTNIEVPKLPKSSPEVIRDIIDDVNIDVSDSYVDSSETFVEFLNRKGVTSLCTDTGMPVDITCKTNTTRANRYRLEHVRALDQKCRCLSTQCGNMASTSGCGLYINGKLRSISPTEAEKLQTLPVDYTKCVSKVHRFHGVGNGWNVRTIAHIFSGINSVKE